MWGTPVGQVYAKHRASLWSSRLWSVAAPHSAFVPAGWADAAKHCGLLSRFCNWAGPWGTGICGIGLLNSRDGGRAENTHTRHSKSRDYNVLLWSGRLLFNMESKDTMLVNKGVIPSLTIPKLRASVQWLGLSESYPKALFKTFLTAKHPLLCLLNYFTVPTQSFRLWPWCYVLEAAVHCFVVPFILAVSLRHYRVALGRKRGVVASNERVQTLKRVL